jgi:hypothetical protein
VGARVGGITATHISPWVQGQGKVDSATRTFISSDGNFKTQRNSVSQRQKTVTKTLIPPCRNVHFSLSVLQDGASPWAPNCGRRRRVETFISAQSLRQHVWMRRGKEDEGGRTPQVQPVLQVHSAAPVHPHPPDMSAALDWWWRWLVGKC